MDDEELRERVNALHAVVSVLLSLLTDEQLANLNDAARDAILRLPIPEVR